MRHGPLTSAVEIAEAEQLVEKWKPRRGCEGDFTAEQRTRILHAAAVAYGNNTVIAERNALTIMWRHVVARHHNYGTTAESLWCRDAAMESVHETEKARDRNAATHTKKVLFRVGNELSASSFYEPTFTQEGTAYPYSNAEIDHFYRVGQTLRPRRAANFKAVLDLALGFGATTFAIIAAHANDFTDRNGLITWDVPVGTPRVIPCGGERLGAIRHLLTVREGQYLLATKDGARPNLNTVGAAITLKPLTEATKPEKFRLAATWRRNRFLAGTRVDVIWYIADQPLPSSISAITPPLTALTDDQMRQAAQAPEPSQLGLPFWGQP